MRLIPVAAIAAAGLAVAAVVYVLTPVRTEPPPAVAEGQGRVAIGGPFVLVNQDGKPVSDKDFAGRYTLVFFGYTHCPDVCPTSLSTIAAARAAMPAGVRDEVTPVFITVDPERDTVPVMRDYVGAFGAGVVGLTGTRAQTDAAAAAYRVYHSRAGEGDDYLVDHSGFIYLMGPDGGYIRHFGFNAPPEEIVRAVEEAVGA